MPKAEKVPKEKKAPKAKAPPKEKKAKKEKKKKDPNAPKKPLSAYMFFCAVQRDVVKKENPDMKATEIISELGKVWGTLSEGDKKKYYDQAEKDKVRYQKAMSTYKPAEEEADEEEEDEEDD